MKNLIGILLISCVLFVQGMGLIAALRSFKPSSYVRRDRPVLARLEQLKKEHPDGQPQAETPHTEFDFGTLNPAQTSEHTFVIRNTGLAPLGLKRGPTTCKCTLAELGQKTIFPGQEGEVTLEWNTGRSEDTFRQSAKIYTSDPQRPQIDFQIHGKVRRVFYAVQESVIFPPILPGETATAQALVLSQEWSAFEIAGITSNLEGLTWQVEPADPQSLADHYAQSGYKIVFTSPPNQTDRWLSGSVSITANRSVADAASVSNSASESIELTLSGKVRSRLALFGPQIDESGLVDFGVLAPGQGAQAQLVLRVRDEAPELAIRALKISPDFLKAEITPQLDADGNPKPALYRIQIEVPKETPPCHHMGAHQGRVELVVDHPRISGITVKVSFAVKSN